VQDLWAMINPCRSEPARDSGMSGKVMLNVLPSSRAGSLPHFFAVFLGGDDVIHRAVHGQFREHDDLLNRHRLMALRAYQLGGEIAGQDTG